MRNASAKRRRTVKSFRLWLLLQKDVAEVESDLCGIFFILPISNLVKSIDNRNENAL